MATLLCDEVTGSLEQAFAFDSGWWCLVVECAVVGDVRGFPKVAVDEGDVECGLFELDESGFLD